MENDRDDTANQFKFFPIIFLAEKIHFYFYSIISVAEVFMKNLWVINLILCLEFSCVQYAHAQSFMVSNQHALSSSATTTGNCQNILSYGGAGDGVTDNTTPLQNLIKSEASNKPCVYFPPGKFNFNSTISYAFTDPIASLTILGAGADQTELTWGGGNGIAISFLGASDSVHIRDLSMTTSGMGGATAISLSQAYASNGNPANAAVSDITGLTIRGLDGYANADYWAVGVNISSVSNVNFLNDSFTGSGGSNASVGVNLSGSSSFQAVVFNFTNSYFQFLGSGIQYGSYVQGVSVSQSNFTGDNYGIVTPSASELGTDQLVILASQFNCSGDGVWDKSGIPNLMISASYFIVPKNAIGIYLQSSWVYSLSGNTFNGSSNSNGIVVGSSAGSGVISSNAFLNMTTGIWLQANSSGVNVQSNVYSNTSNSFVNFGKNNTLGGGSP